MDEKSIDKMAVDVVVQAARLRDGSRRITHITEVLGLEGDVIITQDLFLYDILGEDANGKLIGRHRSTGNSNLVGHRSRNGRPGQGPASGTGSPIARATCHPGCINRPDT